MVILSVSSEARSFTEKPLNLCGHSLSLSTRSSSEVISSCCRACVVRRSSGTDSCYCAVNLASEWLGQQQTCKNHSPSESRDRHHVCHPAVHFGCHSTPLPACLVSLGLLSYSQL